MNFRFSLLIHVFNHTQNFLESFFRPGMAVFVWMKLQSNIPIILLHIVFRLILQTLNQLGGGSLQKVIYHPNLLDGKSFDLLQLFSTDLLDVRSDRAGASSVSQACLI